MRFENKSVIITGGGGKIAKAYAMAFAKEGAKVSLPGHRQRRSCR
jgi:NAD(P)-dependent dehydrogenase (short-subunit alcohol dehydrogenase family)